MTDKQRIDQLERVVCVLMGQCEKNAALMERGLRELKELRAMLFPNWKPVKADTKAADWFKRMAKK